MREILLTRGKVAIVDNHNFEWLSKWKWQAVRAKRGHWYAKRNSRFGKKSKRVRISMHREIVKRIGLLTDGRLWVDHRDGNGLHNWDKNLRPCSPGDNRANSKIGVTNKSGFKGVHWHASRNRWRAVCAGKYLGLFLDKVNAALVYNQAAKRHFGKFAFLNKIEKRVV